ncbi:MAG: murein L,D-transpeptidase catalytic domain family protein [Bacteroidota bacterium]|nr:murein L,D-transpeptidase catalytic domain family protein [Bacteroidota bacterium]
MKKPKKKLSYLFTSVLILSLQLPFVFARPAGPLSLSVPSTIDHPMVSTTNNGEVPGERKISVYDSLHLGDLDLSRQAFDFAMIGYKTLRSMGKLTNDSIISIIDFSLSSATKRLFVLDIKNYKVLFNTYVAHGKNSGLEFAREFSNNPRSNKSSLGFYVTGETYDGEHGYSLRLDGEEKGINNNAYKRAIVMHCASYASENYIRERGYLGRSLGCPAIPKSVYKPLIETIKDGSCLFFYSPNKNYLSHSVFLRSAIDSYAKS